MSWIQYFWKWVSAASPTPVRIIEIIIMFLVLAGLAIKQIQPKWVARMDKLAWQIPFGLLIAVFFISLAVSSYKLYEEQQNTISDLKQQLQVAQKQAYPPITTLMMEPYFKDKDIPLGEFGLINPLLANKTFENCRIHGIVVMYISNTTITHCDFYGDDANFIVTSNQKIGGVLNVKRCTFINCTFKNVSFIGSADEILKIKSGFKFR